jgi:MarR family transcriptional regulator for hemolysin
MFVDNSSVVRLLDNLEKAGLIQRKEGETDRRAKIILLTPRGRAIADRVEAVARRIRTDALAGLSEKDIETTIRVLDHVCRMLDPAAEPVQ